MIPAPEGLHQAVCCDVVDKGLQETGWGKKHKIQIRWQTEALMDDGLPYLIISSYTNSLDPKSSLHKLIKGWRGKGFTKQEIEEGFDLETLIDTNCQLTVEHNPTDNGTFANVISISPLGKNMEPLKVRSKYQRVLDRPDYQPPAEPAADDDSDLNF
jgi:hypothetical protein